jgi:hypothetical protein
MNWKIRDLLQTKLMLIHTSNTYLQTQPRGKNFLCLEILGKSGRLILLLHTSLTRINIEDLNQLEELTSVKWGTTKGNLSLELNELRLQARRMEGAF